MPTRNYFQGLQALMPINSVDFIPTIGNLPISCLQDAYKDLQCTACMIGTCESANQKVAWIYPDCCAS